MLRIASPSWAIPVLTMLMAVMTLPGSALELDWLGSDVRLDTDPAGEADSDYPRIAADGESIWVVWEDDRNGKEDIYLNYSHDRGQTWLATDKRINKNTAGASRSINAAVAGSGSRVYVAWADTRNSGNVNSTDIFFNSSSNGGQTWRASDLRLDTDAAGSSWSRSPAIVASGSKVCVAWQDGRDNDWQTLNSLYFNCSTDGGNTWWASDQAIVVNGGAAFTEMDLVAEGNNIYVFFQQLRTAGDNVYFNSSANWGTSWNGEVKINDTTNGECKTPAMAVSGGRIYLAWWHYYGYTTRLMFDRSIDNGGTWLPADTQIAYAGNPEIAASGDSVRIIYPGNNNISLQASDDAGTTWLSTPSVVREYDVKDFDSFQVFTTGRTVLVSWYDQRCVDESIWANASSDGGLSFETYPTYLNDTACSTGTARADRPQAAVVASEQLLAVVWEEYRGLKRDIFVNVGTWRIFADGFETGNTSRW